MAQIFVKQIEPFRALTSPEQNADLPMVNTVLTTLTANARAAATPVIEEIFEDIIAQSKPFVKKGRLPDKEFRVSVGGFKRIVLNSVVLANLWGRLLATAEAERQGWVHKPFRFDDDDDPDFASVGGTRVPLDPVTPASSARSFAGKIPIGRAGFELLTDQAKALAFTVAGIERNQILQRVKSILIGAINEELSFEAFSARAREEGLVFISEAHAENVFRTNINAALNQGRLEMFRETEGFVRAVQFSAILDNRTTEVCRKWDGVVVPLNSPMVDAITPPLHFNCRSTLISVADIPENKDIKTTPRRELPDVAPQKGFGSIPGKEPFRS